MCREEVMLHPSDLGNIKKAIPQILKNRLKKFDQVRQGVLSHFTSKFEVLYGGRGRIEGTSPLVGYTVRYSAVFSKPTVGAKIVGKVVGITGSNTDSVCVMSEVDGDIICVSKLTDRFKVNQIQKSEESGSESEADSVFEAKQGEVC